MTTELPEPKRLRAVLRALKAEGVQHIRCGDWEVTLQPLDGYAATSAPLPLEQIARKIRLPIEGSPMEALLRPTVEAEAAKARGDAEAEELAEHYAHTGLVPGDVLKALQGGVPLDD